MSQREGWNMCRIICWALAAVAGILVVKGIIGAVGFIAAVMAGAALAVFIGLVLTRLFCMKQGAGADMVPSAEAAKASAASAAQATTQAAKDAGAKAKDSAADAGAAVKAAAGNVAAKTGAAADVGASDVADAKPSDTAAAKPAGEKAAKPAAAKPAAKEGADKPAAKATKAAAKPAAKPAKAAKAAASDAPAPSAEETGTRPEALSAPKGGKADNLKEIKGIGPKLETMLHGMGFYHFDQIASWGADEVAWVDSNIKGFKGRVSRDNWVEQAKVLAAGGETEFSKRVGDGDVY